jgi:3D (Asp-Asp-Asp) domain-containing protein
MEKLTEFFKTLFILVIGMLYYKFSSSMFDLAQEKSKIKMKPIVVEDVTLKHIKKPKFVLKHIVATMYNAVEKQCDKDPLTTAGLYKINPKKASQHKWIALSRNLLKRWEGPFNYGDLVLITNAGKKTGIYKVVDTMNEIYRNRIDILETVGTPLYKYKNITIAKL